MRCDNAVHACILVLFVRWLKISTDSLTFGISCDSLCWIKAHHPMHLVVHSQYYWLWTSRHIGCASIQHSELHDVPKKHTICTTAYMKFTKRSTLHHAKRERTFNIFFLTLTMASRNSSQLKEHDRRKRGRRIFNLWLSLHQHKILKRTTICFSIIFYSHTNKALTRRHVQFRSNVLLHQGNLNPQRNLWLHQWMMRSSRWIFPNTLPTVPQQFNVFIPVEFRPTGITPHLLPLQPNTLDGSFDFTTIVAPQLEQPFSLPSILKFIQDNPIVAFGNVDVFHLTKNSAKCRKEKIHIEVAFFAVLESHVIAKPLA